MSDSVAFDRRTLELFRAAYNRAVKNRHDEFTFQDQQFVVGYAKYLLLYLDNQFDKIKPTETT